jgi:hypothetical protein
MNFHELMLTHTKWKLRLRNYIDGRLDGGPMDPGQVSLDGLCELGKWISGEGSQFAGNPHFEQLKQDHAYFHKCAAEVVSRANAGDIDGANEMLGPGGEFSEVSSAMVSAMNQLQRHVAAAQSG